MIIDVNAYIGPFAFRRLRHNTAASLLKLMDARRIHRAVVSSAAAITYRNTQPANIDLAAECRDHGDRLIPFAVINPAYAGWHDDLKACRDKGMAGVRLYPAWHNYKLSDRRCRELIDAATELGMAISLPFRVEDPRQRSWLVDVPDLEPADVVELVRSCPRARFFLLNGLSYVRSPLGRGGSGLPANYVIEISRLDPLLANEIGQLITNLGAGRVVFGSGMPFSEPGTALLKLDVLGASKEDKERIAWKNAERWLQPNS